MFRIHWGMYNVLLMARSSTLAINFTLVCQTAEVKYIIASLVTLLPSIQNQIA